MTFFSSYIQDSYIKLSLVGIIYTSTYHTTDKLYRSPATDSYLKVVYY